VGTKIRATITVAGVFVSVCGFVVQFTGLRGMHWSASIAQLGAIIVMTALRAWVRRNLAKNPMALPLVSGHELDWLAMTLGDCSKAPWLHPPEVNGAKWSWKIAAVEDLEKLEEVEEDSEHEEYWVTHGYSYSEDSPEGEGDSEAQEDSKPKCCDLSSSAQRVMIIRRDLGELIDWPGPASAEAVLLARAIELAMDTLFDDSSINEFTWSLGAHWLEEQSGRESIHFHMKRYDGGWRAYSDELEAALSLWLYSVNDQENPIQETKSRRWGKALGKGGSPQDAWLRKGTSAKPALQLLGRYTAALYQDLQWWIPDGALRVKMIARNEPNEPTDTRLANEVEAHRIVGCAPNWSPDTRYRALDSPQLEPSSEEAAATDRILAIESYTPLKTLYVQYIFTTFMWAAVKKMKEPIKGGADVRPTQTEGTRDTSKDPAWKSIALHSARLSKMAQDIQAAAGLGSLEEIYFAIIPPLSAMKKLPNANAIIEWARVHAKPHEQLGHWEDAAKVYLWLFRISKTSLRQDDVVQATALLMEFLKALVDTHKMRKDSQVYYSSDFHYFTDMDDGYELEQLILSLHDELRSADSTVLSRLLRLYKLQDRPWGCSFIEDSLGSSGHDVLLKFTNLHWAACKDELWVSHILNNSRLGINKKDVLSWTPLHYAAAKPFRWGLEALLEYLADINPRDIHGRTPLHYACRHHNDDGVVRVLLHSGADIRIRDTDGRAPIHFAAMHGCHATVESLIAAGADIDVADSSGYTPLLLAAYHGHTGVVTLLWRDSSPRLRDRNGRTPLHLAVAGVGQVSNGHTVGLLLKGLEGVELEAKERSGRTPLHLAAAGGHEATVEMLLDNGANIEAEDNYKRRPVGHAARNGHEAVVRLLLKRGATTNSNDIKYAIDNGDVALVGLLLDSLRPANKFDDDDYPPLTLATRIGDEAMVRFLLEKGAAIRGRELHEAAQRGHAAVIELLLGRGADIEARDGYIRPPLHVAAQWGQNAMVRLLLEKGANIEAEDDSGMRALHWAARGRRGFQQIDPGAHAAVVRLLLEMGANFEAKDKEGRRPLWYAVKARDSDAEIIKLLLEKGATPLSPEEEADSSSDRY
jgi:ankyrin repeat protein